MLILCVGVGARVSTVTVVPLVHLQSSDCFSLLVLAPEAWGVHSLRFCGGDLIWVHLLFASNLVRERLC